MFAYYGGSSRHSPRNRYVAQALNQAGMGTLVFDLLTPTEETDRSFVFDIELLAISRGGRPDLAALRLPLVRAPTLLIVGGHDDLALSLNRDAHTMPHCESRIAMVPRATHLFEEPGTLEHAAQSARDWFVEHLTSSPPTARPTRHR